MKEEQQRNDNNELRVFENWKDFQKEKKKHFGFALKKEDTQKKIGKEDDEETFVADAMKDVSRGVF